MLNWFDVTEPEGRLSLNTPIGEVMKTFKGKLVMVSVGIMLMKQLKAKSKSKESGSGGFSVSGFKITPDLMKMIGGFSLLRASNMMGMINLSVTKEQLLDINKKLNKIKKKN